MSGYSIQTQFRFGEKCETVQVLRHCDDVPPGRAQHQDPLCVQHQVQGCATLDDDYKLVFRRVYILAITILTCDDFITNVKSNK